MKYTLTLLFLVGFIGFIGATPADPQDPAVEDPEKESVPEQDASPGRKTKLIQWQLKMQVLVFITFLFSTANFYLQLAKKFYFGIILFRLSVNF